MAAFHTIRLFLTQVRRRRLQLAASEAALASLIAAAILFGLSVWSANMVSDGHVGHVLPAAMCTVIAASLISFVGLFFRVVWGLRRDVDTARLVQHQLPALGGDILSCVELVEVSQASSAVQSETSRAFTHALVADTASRVLPIRIHSVVHGDRVRTLLRSLAVTVAVLTVLGALYPQGLREGVASLREGRRGVLQPHERQRVIEHDVVVGDLKIGLTFPAYTHLSSRVEMNTSGVITALAGAKVRVSTRALVRSARAMAIFDSASGGQIPFEVDGEMLSGQFTVTEPGTFQFQLVGSDGTTHIERTRRTIQVVDDERPEIDILQPAMDVEVPNAQPVRLSYAASDDFGVSRIDLVTAREATHEPPIHRRVATPDGVRQFVAEAEVDLTRLEVEPGETVEVWLEVYDNNTVADALQMSRSRRIKIKRHSPAEQHDENIQAQRALFDVMVSHLADRLESPVAQKHQRGYDRQVSAQRVVSDGLLPLIRQVGELGKRLAADPLASQDVIAVIQDFLERYEAHHRVEQGTLRLAIGETKSSRRADSLSRLYQANESAVAELERDVYRLNELILQQSQKRLVARGKAIAEAQSELAELLEQLAAADSSEVRHQIQQKLQRLLRQVQKLMSDMSGQAQLAPYEHVNRDALEAADNVKNIQSLLGSIQQMQEAVRSGDMQRIRELADEVGKQIQTLNTELQADLEGMSDDRNNAGQSELRRLLRDVDKAIARQDAVERRTKGLAARGKRALDTHIKEREAPRIAKQLEAIRELKRRVGAVDPEALHEDDAKALQVIQEGISDLRDTLAQEDLGQAIQLSKAVRDALRSLEREVEMGVERMVDREGDSYRVKKRKEQGRRIVSGRRKAQRIAADLDKMMPTPNDLFDRSERKRLERLAERQKRVQERLERLKAKLPGLEAKLPGVTEGFSKMIDEASKEMGEAAKRLSESRPGRALGHEERAKERMNKLKESTAKELQRSSGGAQDQPGQGSKVPKVAIPDADRHAVPKEYRDALLRSLREHAPTGYKRLIQRYYEALVK